MKEEKRKQRQGMWLAILCSMTLLLFAASLWIGPVPLSWNTPQQAELSGHLLWVIRLPRALGALIGGASLALAGAVMQQTLANPLAAPHSMGINAGAGLGALIGSLFFGINWKWVALSTFLGALLAIALTAGLSARFRLRKTTLILAGVGFSSVFSAASDILILLFPDAMSGYAAFRMGSVSALSIERLIPCVLLCGMAIGFVLCFYRQLILLSLGVEQAQAMGLHAARWMLLFLFAAGALSGGVVAMAGLIGFVGLVCPHLVRLLIPDLSFSFFAACLFAGACLFLGADLAGRMIFAPFEIPAGVLLSLFGGPYFLWLLFSQAGRKL